MKQLFLLLALILPFCAKSQFKESFDGPEIISANSWKGDLARFKINAKQQLQLNAPAQAGKTGLYFPSGVLAEREWNAWVQLRFDPSANNYAIVGLWSESPDPAASAESFFVRVGYKDDNIVLCRRTGGKQTELICGRKLFAGNSTEVRIKVITHGGNCLLYTRTGAETDFFKEGEAACQLADRPGYLALTCIYTASRSKQILFDDVSLRPYAGVPVEEPDGEVVVAPRIEMQDSLSLVVAFDRPVNLNEAVIALSQVGEADEYWVSEDGMFVKLVFATVMQKGTRYELTWTHIYTQDGQEVRDGKIVFVCDYEGGGQPSDDPEAPDKTGRAPRPGEVVINEIMPDPVGCPGLPEIEYVELYNTTSVPIALSGCYFLYGEKSVSLPASILPARGYGVLYKTDKTDKTGRTIHLDPGGIGIPVAGFPVLANTGKQLRLVSKTKETVDNVTYDQTFYGDKKKSKGYSLECIDPLSKDRTAANWHASADRRGGTPGSKNTASTLDPEQPDIPDDPDLQESIIPGTLILNEILPEPFVDGSEYIELYNRSSQSLDLSGVAIALRKQDGSLSTSYPLAAIQDKILPHDYVVVTKNKTGVTSFYHIPFPDKLKEVQKLPLLANTSATVVLFNVSDHTVIDELNYSSQWHAPFIKTNKGVSLERISPDRPTQEPSNWTSAAVDAGYGTPGYENSAGESSSGNQPVGINPPQLDETTGRYAVMYRMKKAGYRCVARIFDGTGCLQMDISPDGPLGVEGTITWSETVNGAKRLPMGVYIFYAEFYHPAGGDTQRYKKVFVVR